MCNVNYTFLVCKVGSYTDSNNKFSVLFHELILYIPLKLSQLFSLVLELSGKSKHISPPSSLVNMHSPVKVYYQSGKRSNHPHTVLNQAARSLLNK